MVSFRPHPTHWARPGLKLGVATAGATVAAFGWLRPRRVVVAGDSMQPALQAGDHLLVIRLPGPPRPGRIIAVRDPRRPDRILVKRVRAWTPGGIDVRGDNPAASTDSGTFGPVRLAAVVGTVVYRYLPPARSGFWP